MKIVLVSLSLVLSLGCGSDSKNNGENRIGPENLIINNASESEFKEGAAQALGLFDDFGNLRQNFIKDTTTPFTFITNFKSQMFNEESETTEHDDQIDAAAIKNAFSTLDSCAGSFDETDKMWKETKTQIEQLLIELSEGKTEIDGQENGAQLQRAETDDAIAYDFQSGPEGMSGMEMSGRIMGRMDKDNGLIQIYKKMNQVIDYKKLFDAMFEQFKNINMPDGMEGPETEEEMPSGIMKMDVESTVEMNTTKKTITSNHYIRSESLNNSKDEENFTLEIRSEEILKAGENPAAHIKISQKHITKDGDQYFDMLFSMELVNATTLAVNMTLDHSEENNNVEIGYKLKATENTCTFTKD